MSFCGRLVASAICGTLGTLGISGDAESQELPEFHERRGIKQKAFSGALKEKEVMK